MMPDTKYADLHIHTHFSDSTASPEDVAKDAHHAGLDAIAITDHDTVDGIAPAIAAAKAYGIEVIPGIELSCEMNGRDIHILGYCFDFTDAALSAHLKTMQQARVSRMQKMIDKLKEMGIEDIDLAEVCALTESDAVGRPHLAQVMYDKGHTTQYRQAFDKYIAEGKPAFVKKFMQSPAEAIALIKGVGGVAVLAHPMITLVDEMIPQFVEAGLGGIEVYYPRCTKTVTNFYTKIAQKHHLLTTGGSDAHGNAKPHTHIGNVKVPYAVVEQLKERTHAQ